MRKTKYPSPKLALTLVLVSVLLVVIAIGNAVVGFISNRPAIRAYCAQTEFFISQNQSQLESIFSSVFDLAKDCNGDPTCEAAVSSAIFADLRAKDKVAYFESTYFIRLKDDRIIEKLFLSGQYTDKKQLQAKEDKVIRLLRGTRGRICDEGWKIDGNETDTTWTGSHMRYLYDMFSEAEIIFPVHKDGKVIGAVVKAWGD